MAAHQRREHRQSRGDAVGHRDVEEERLGKNGEFGESPALVVGPFRGGGIGGEEKSEDPVPDGLGRIREGRATAGWAGIRCRALTNGNKLERPEGRTGQAAGNGCQEH